MVQDRQPLRDQQFESLAYWRVTDTKIRRYLVLLQGRARRDLAATNGVA